MMEQLEGQTAIVTGASSGIGTAIAKELINAGANVVFAARNKEKLESIVAEKTIPIHLTDGVIDGWGSKWISLLMPGIIVFVYVLSILFIRYLKKHDQSIILVSWV